MFPARYFISMSQIPLYRWPANPHKSQPLQNLHRLFHQPWACTTICSRPGSAAAVVLSPQSLPGVFCSCLHSLALWGNKSGWFLVKCSMSSPEGNKELVRRRWQKLNLHFPWVRAPSQAHKVCLAWPSTRLEMSQSINAGAGHCCCAGAAASTSEHGHFGMEMHICCPSASALPHSSNAHLVLTHEDFQMCGNATH